jgi:alpha-amylase/alpha-mannosidase (GH57 family)
MAAILPLHRQLQERGQVEVSTTPFAHPILPLLMDTDQATIDRPGATYPHRFAHPEDAAAQVNLAVAHYTRWFGRTPRGMWPAEGAVSQSIIPLYAQAGVCWIATDQGVLARSGRWGYQTDHPDVLCQPYRAEEGNDAIVVFFRDTRLSDNIGFRYQGCTDPNQIARDFLNEIKERFVRDIGGGEDRVLTVALDGENAWGAYCEDARPFLDALYGLLEHDPEVRTVTFAEYLDGNPERCVAPHPPIALSRIYDLFTGSWIDENGSAPGVDLGTWIGEEEENRAWELLGRTRDALEQAGATPESRSGAFAALRLAEGSDWFWWYGSDQDSGNDSGFDDLFRGHLKGVYRGLSLDPPAELDEHIISRTIVWTFTRRVRTIQPGDRLTIQTNCPGILTWCCDDGETREAVLSPVGGVMAGVRRHQLTLGPFPPATRRVHFRFRCTHPGCDGTDVCCSAEESLVTIHSGGDR